MLSIVIPTYNEAENIGPLLKGIRQVLRGSGTDYEVILVDDSSPDRTAERALSFPEMPVRVLRRRGRSGLSSAIMEGFRQARGNTLLAMDADLSHPPGLIPRMVRAMEGKDMVIASRYAERGSVEGWCIPRRIMSRAASLLAGPLLPSSDPLSGFFAVRRAAIGGMAPRAIGFKLCLEIGSRLRGSGVAEVSYRFRPRERGRSKMGPGAVAGFLAQMVLLWLERAQGRRWGPAGFRGQAAGRQRDAMERHGQAQSGQNGVL